MKTNKNVIRRNVAGDDILIPVHDSAKEHNGLFVLTPTGAEIWDMLVEEKGRRVLFSGCSHAGILDIVEWFSPDVLIGGFHVSKMALGAELTALGEALAAHNTDYYTCHCTGVEQYAFLRGRMPRLRYLAGGETVQI